jgi:hypothetical protein
MISAKRMVTSFSRRGGREFANLGEKLTPDQLAYLENMAEGEPIIAKMSSEDEWFARTKSRFVFQCSKTLRRVPFRVPFDEICIVAIPKADALNRRIKTQGGELGCGTAGWQNAPCQSGTDWAAFRSNERFAAHCENESQTKLEGRSGR